MQIGVIRQSIRTTSRRCGTEAGACNPDRIKRRCRRRRCHSFYPPVESVLALTRGGAATLGNVDKCVFAHVYVAVALHRVRLVQRWMTVSSWANRLR